MPTKTMGLNRLPDELNILVFRHLYVDHGNNDDLTQVVRCCRRFYNLAIPILYSSCTVKTKARSFAFLQTVLKRPDLANYGRRLTGLPEEFDELPYFLDIYSRPRFHFDTRMEGLEAALESGCDDKSLRDKWSQTFSLDRSCQDSKWFQVPGNLDSITALLILLLPNLSNFKLPGSSWKATDCTLEFTPYVFARALRLQNSKIHSAYSLSNLRNVEFSVCQEGDFPSLDSILPFLHLKSIRHVTLSNSFTDQSSDDDTNDDNIEPISHVTHLSFLPTSDIDSRSLGKFLQGFHGLTSFSYVHWSHWNNFLSSQWIPPKIRRGLLPSKDSLEELILVNEMEDGYFTSNYFPKRMYMPRGWNSHQLEPTVLPLGSLLEFGKLRRLDTSVLALMGRVGTDRSVFDVPFRETPKPEDVLRLVESLPESLEELALRTCFRDIYAMMEVLFERRRQNSLQRLKKVALFFQKDFSEEQILNDDDGIQCEMEGNYLGIQVTRLPVGFFSPYSKLED